MVKTIFFAILVIFSTNAVSETEPLTIAFVGDQGTSENARDVLQLVANEEADLLLIQGDLGYSRNAASKWIANIDEILGTEFPVVLSIGNHENFEWLAYRQWFLQRIEDVPELICQGNIGVKAHCSFRDVSILQVAPGVDEVRGIAAQDGYAEFLESELATSANVWRFCSWHKTQARMQVGGKPDETGWEVYSACLKHGGIVATAHEHSYSRTYLMNDFENQVVAHRGDLLEIGPGSSFAFVSGLGGHGIRGQKRSGDWWASVYTKNQRASFGALFCTLAGRSANCQFKDIAGVVPDRFTLENRNIPGDAAVQDDIDMPDLALLVSDNQATGRTDLQFIFVLLALFILRRVSLQR